MSLKNGITCNPGTAWCTLPIGFRPKVDCAQNMQPNTDVSSTQTLTVKTDGTVIHRGLTLNNNNGFRANFVFFTK